MTPALSALAEAHGLIWRYKDGAGRNTEAPEASLRAALGAMGVAAENAAEDAESLAAFEARRRLRVLPDWIVTEAGQAASVEFLHERPVHWHLTLEDGSRSGGLATRLLDMGVLPAGYHRLEIEGRRTTLLSAPPHLAGVPRGWGVVAPLYGLRNVGRGGIGDYSDLADFAKLLGRKGAGFLGINPVHAGFTADADAFSPYSPSSRAWLSVMHLADGGPEPAADGRLIDYRKALPARLRALEERFGAQGDASDADFREWRRSEGSELEAFATHQALSEVFGAYWCDWPEEYRSPEKPAVAEFAPGAADRIAFHAWLQWQAAQQLASVQKTALSAGMRHGLYLDLAVGTHPQGAETWADPKLFAHGVSLGAPPDAFASEGQNWNLAPLRPDALAERGFEPLARILRRQLRYCGILRIDHILGFDRAFWVPEGLPGLYVRMPREALLATLRIEAARAGAVIVGEDLGAIPEGLRDALAASGILGCRLAMFERDWDGDRSFLAPEDYAPQTIASFGSHDLPLWRGWRKGQDIDWRLRLGSLPAKDAVALTAERKNDVEAFDAACGTRRGNFRKMTEFVARTGSALAAVQIEDVLGAVEQPNLPGTVSDHPNWRRRLPSDLDRIAGTPALDQVAETMKRNGR